MEKERKFICRCWVILLITVGSSDHTVTIEVQECCIVQLL